MNILITICARGGSKGIPRKNIREINGLPLIAYSIAHAKEFAEHYPCDITLSTEDEEIAQVAAKYGLATDYRRPAEMATDQAGKVAVLYDVMAYEEQRTGKQYDFLLDLDVSGPIRTFEDVKQGLELILQNEAAYNLFSVNRANKNPYFNMVEQNEDGFYDISKRPPGDVKSRQAAPKVYELNASFYFYRRSFFNDGLTGAITSRSLIYEMTHLCFDLDYMEDFEYLSYLAEKGKVNLMWS